MWQNNCEIIATSGKNIYFILGPKRCVTRLLLVSTKKASFTDDDVAGHNNKYSSTECPLKNPFPVTTTVHFKGSFKAHDFRDSHFEHKCVLPRKMETMQESSFNANNSLSRQQLIRHTQELLSAACYVTANRSLHSLHITNSMEQSPS